MLKNRIKKGYADFPAGMDFLLTYDCNLRCKYCPWWGVNNKRMISKIYMDTSSALKLIDEISIFKPFIRLFGGEPFIHPDWFEIVQYAKSKGIYCTSVSNGTLVYEQADKLVKSGLLSLGVSWDGFNNDQRGKNTHILIEEGIKELIKVKNYYKSEYPLIEIYCTINESNYDQIIDFGNYLKDYKIHKYRLQHLIWFSENQYKESKAILKKELNVDSFFGVEENYIRNNRYNIDYNIVTNQIKIIKESNYPFKVEFHPDLDFEEIPSFFVDVEFKRIYNTSCKTMENFCYISPEGILFPCLTIEIANVFEKSFIKSWNSKKARKFRKLIRKIGRLPLCSRCPD